MKLNDLIQRVRAHPGIADSALGKTADDNFGFIVAQISFDVLQDLGESVGRSFGPKRNYTFTDPTTTTATLDGNGAANLSTLVAENGLLLENLQFGEIRHLSSAYPLERVGTVAELNFPSNYDSIIFRYALIGMKLKTRGASSSPLAGDLSFACPHVNGLDDLSVQLEDDAVAAIVGRLRGMPPAGSAPAQEGAKQ